MVNDKVTTNGKVIKLSIENYDRLKDEKFELRMPSFYGVGAKLLEEDNTEVNPRLRSGHGKRGDFRTGSIISKT
ncbi:MAG: hypothetical protein B2I17_00150 [Thermoplasmatales archaeon B_DKE]|nr:MAG: hypothetical protein B2I17_00150 [Thermoplasmatales archaeon B_DKE]